MANGDMLLYLLGGILIIAGFYYVLKPKDGSFDTQHPVYNDPEPTYPGPTYPGPTYPGPTYPSPWPRPPLPSPSPWPRPPLPSPWPRPPLPSPSPWPRPCDIPTIMQTSTVSNVCRRCESCPFSQRAACYSAAKQKFGVTCMQNPPFCGYNPDSSNYCGDCCTKCNTACPNNKLACSRICDSEWDICSCP